MQKDPELIKLTSKQLKAIGLAENPVLMEQRKKFGNAMRSSLETILEWIAAADLYTDFVVLNQLLHTDHRAWSTITIFSLLAPFFAC